MTSVEDAPKTIALDIWVRRAIADTEGPFTGIEFYELSDAPISSSGLALLDTSCALLTGVHEAMRGLNALSEARIPYVKFYLPATKKLSKWTPRIWGRLCGDRAALEIANDGHVFYGPVWESHHETLVLPLTAWPQYKAIFRRFKGFYDGEPWDDFMNEIYVFSDPETWSFFKQA